MGWWGSDVRAYLKYEYEYEYE